MIIDFNKLAVEIHAENKAKGWWDNPDRCVYETLQLVNTEISEATEGERSNLPDDKLPHRKMGEVELADAVIRLLDMGGKYGWTYSGDNYDPWIDEMPTVAGKHLCATYVVCEFAHEIRLFGKHSSHLHIFYTAAINTVLRIGDDQGYDVMGALLEKREFNKTRKDHSREARAAAHGKKF